MPGSIRKRDKRKPWIIGVCVFIALAMIFSTFLIILEQFFMKDTRPPFDEKAFLEELEQRAEMLRVHIEHFGESAPFLRELGNVYRTIAYFKKDRDDPALKKEIDNDLHRAVAVYKKVITLSPEDIESYLILFEMYHELGLKEDADNIAGIAEKVLLAILEDGPENNRNRYFYSYLLQYHHRDYESAREQIVIILESEPETSELYLIAVRQKGYLDLLISIEGEREREEDDQQVGETEE